MTTPIVVSNPDPNAYVAQRGHITVNPLTYTLSIHDGVTPGGRQLFTLSTSQVAAGAIGVVGISSSGTLLTTTGTAITIGGSAETGMLTPVEVTTTTYVVQATDLGKKLRFTHASGCDVELPPGVGIPIGFTCVLRCASPSGILTVSTGTGVTMNVPVGASSEALDTGSDISVHKVAADEWDIAGSLLR